MLNFINNKKMMSLLFSLPVLWVVTGMLWDGDGDMRLVPLVLFALVISIVKFKFRVINENFRHNFWIKLLLISSFFGGVAYQVYGFDSRELRATITVLILLIIVPKIYHTKTVMQWFLLIASLSCVIYGYYFQSIMPMGRGSWPINAIPFATICGLICITALGLLLSNFSGKLLIVNVLSSFLSFCGLVLSQSRGPILAALLVIALLSLLLVFHRNRILSVFMILSFIFCIYGLTRLPVVQERIGVSIGEYQLIKEGNYNTSLGIRLKMISISFDLWRERPILGYGKDIKHEFNRLEANERITPDVNRLISMTFHNGYLDKFVLYGVPGGVIFLVFLLYPIWAARDVSLARGSALLWGPALFISVCNFSDAPFINAQAAIYYMFIIGSVTMMLSNEKDRE